MNFWWFCLIAFAVSLVLTGFLRQYALAKKLIDIPNQRSSHTAPTPRGGGVGFVVSFLAALPILTNAGLVSSSICLALWGAGSAVAVTGF
jgi:Fuc2NAc and GlcNAc transferase